MDLLKDLHHIQDNLQNVISQARSEGYSEGYCEGHDKLEFEIAEILGPEADNIKLEIQDHVKVLVARNRILEKDRARMNWLQANSWAFVRDRENGKGFIKLGGTVSPEDDYNLRRAIDEALDEDADV